MLNINACNVSEALQLCGTERPKRGRHSTEIAVFLDHPLLAGR